MSWFDILKNQVLSNTSLGSTMDWENPEIEEEDDDCRRKLIEIYRRGMEEASVGAFEINIYANVSKNEEGISLGYAEAKKEIMKIPEEQACIVLENFKNKPHFNRHLKKPHSMGVSTNKNRDTIHFKRLLSKTTSIDFVTPELEYTIIVEWDEDKDSEEIRRKYIGLCKYIFGTEYYNSTYEEVFGK